MLRNGWPACSGIPGRLAPESVAGMDRNPHGVVYFNISGDVIAVADVLHERAAEPRSALSWLEIGPLQINHGWVLLLYVMSYIASLMFYFRMRRGTTEKDVLAV